MTVNPAGEPAPPIPPRDPDNTYLRSTLSTAAVLGVIILLGLGLRLANLGGKSLWLDEAYSVIESRLPDVATLEWVDPVHPPFHYLLLHYWMPAFGDSEFSVRLPSVLVSLGNILLMYGLARRLFGPRPALLAAALLAFSPLEIWYAQEARMYIFVTTAGLLMALGLVRGDWWGGLLYFLGLGLGLYADYPAIPLWAAISALWFIGWWQRGRPRRPLLIWLLATTGGWLLYRPYWGELHFFFTENLHYPFLFEQTMRRLGIARLTGWQLGLGLLISTLFVLAGALILQRLLRHPRWSRPVGLAILAGFLLITLSMLFPRLYSIKRILVTGWPLIILLVVWIVWNLVPARRPVSLALLGVSLLCSVVAIFALPKDDWRAATAYLAGQITAEEEFWLDPPWHFRTVQYYQEDLPYRLTRPEQIQTFLDSEQLPGVWIIADRNPGLPVPGTGTEQWLDENWVLIEAVPFHNLEVRFYRPDG